MHAGPLHGSVKCYGATAAGAAWAPASGLPAAGDLGLVFWQQEARYLQSFKHTVALPEQFAVLCE